MKQCFDNIQCNNETVASIEIGTGLIGVLSGANYSEIVKKMEKPSTNLVIYSL